MNLKKLFMYLMVLFVVFGLAMTGCDNGTPTDGDDGTGDAGDTDGVVAIGEDVGDGWIVSYVDEGGGYIADKTIDSDDYKMVTGIFTTDQTWDSDYVYLLDAMVFIGNDTAATSAVLTIEAGTLILGNGGITPGTLVITRYSQIEAVGTAAAPIVFTSALPAGSRAAGDWGGLVINGLATVNLVNGTGEGEGSSGTYGGGLNDDDSGTLKYVRVEYAGRVFTSEDELNGIAFQAVGSGTEVDYIQVHQNKDDGVEFFGGTVQVKHVVLTGNQDDSLDWTSGWIGSAQYVITQHYPGTGDQAIEADNLEDDTEATPRSAPILANFTMVGNGSSEGVLFRRGTDATLINTIVTAFDEAGGEALDETHDSGDANTVSYEGVLVDSETAIGDSSYVSSFTTPTNGNGIAQGSTYMPTGYMAAEEFHATEVDDDGDPVSLNTYSFAMQPTADPSATAGTIPAADNAGNALADTDYVGAVDPDAATAWYSGWITTDMD
jgi:hypothetical protein